MYHGFMFWVTCEWNKATGLVLLFKAAMKLALMSVSSKRSEDPFMRAETNMACVPSHRAFFSILNGTQIIWRLD